jgi:hypothetical protein
LVMTGREAILAGTAPLLTRTTKLMESLKDLFGVCILNFEKLDKNLNYILTMILTTG